MGKIPLFLYPPFFAQELTHRPADGVGAGLDHLVFVPGWRAVAGVPDQPLHQVLGVGAGAKPDREGGGQRRDHACAAAS